MRIRPAKPADGPAIREVVRTALVEHGLPPDPSGTDADLDDVDAFYVARGGFFAVAVDDDDRVIGTVGVLPIGHGACELRKMYLAKASRGFGFGKRLLDHAIAEARRLGFTKMELETAAPLRKAMKLYEENGFRRVERPISVGRCDRAYEREI